MTPILSGMLKMLDVPAPPNVATLFGTKPCRIYAQTQIYDLVKGNKSLVQYIIQY